MCAKVRANRACVDSALTGRLSPVHSSIPELQDVRNHGQQEQLAASAEKARVQEQLSQAHGLLTQLQQALASETAHRKNLQARKQKMEVVALCAL